MQEFLGLMGYLLAFIATLAAWVFWRRVANWQLSADEAQRSRDEMALASKDVRHELDQFKDRLEKSQAEVRKLRDQISRDKGESKSQVAERQSILANLEEARAKAERKADNFESQCEALLKQIRTADELRIESERRYNELSKEFEGKVQQSRENAETKNAQLRSDLQQIRSDFDGLKQRAQQLEELTKLASPEDLKRQKRKIANLEHLLMSMRGLKEMAEERNQNWEMALRILSTAVLKERDINRDGDDQLGPLVGAALEAVGCALVRDEWTGHVPPESTAANAQTNESPVS